MEAAYSSQKQGNSGFKGRIDRRSESFPKLLIFRMVLLGVALVAVLYTIYKMNSGKR